MNSTAPRYTKLPNSLLDWIFSPQADLSLREMKVMMVVFRFTYGYRRPSAPLSNGFVSGLTGINPADVNRAFASLCEKSLLLCTFTRKTRFVTIKPNMYRIRGVKPADSGDSPHQWQITTDISGDSPPNKIKKERESLDWLDDDSPSEMKKKKPVDRSQVKPSSLEAEFCEILARHGVPAGQREYEFDGWFFDFAWPDHLVAVEIDGGMYGHSSHLTAEGHQNDCNKANAAAAAGWHVLRLTADLMRSAHSLNPVIRTLLARLSPGSPLPEHLAPEPVDTRLPDWMR